MKYALVNTLSHLWLRFEAFQPVAKVRRCVRKCVNIKST